MARAKPPEAASPNDRMSGAPEKEGGPRPWGDWTVLVDDPAFKVKRIVILPGRRTSYQTHARRREHWTVVEGTARVTLDGRDIPLAYGEHLVVPMGAPHRIANPDGKPLVFIEVQTGGYLGEDDIVRLEDDYGRTGGG